MESRVVVRRLSPVDVAVARQTFAVMIEAFQEGPSVLSDAYLERLLGRPDFWAFSASIGDEVIGGVTAHTLPMTRNESEEVFLYDIAILQRFRRLGAGRMLYRSTKSMKKRPSSIGRSKVPSRPYASSFGSEKPSTNDR
jgi:aminoglycoside 3-N-acetyltransferase I